VDKSFSSNKSYTLIVTDSVRLTTYGPRHMMECLRHSV